MLADWLSAIIAAITPPPPVEPEGDDGHYTLDQTFERIRDFVEQAVDLAAALSGVADDAADDTAQRWGTRVHTTFEAIMKSEVEPYITQWLGPDFATEAATLLDDTWHIIGTGRRTYLLRTPVEWWVQYLSYENTAVGRLIGYQAFLGRPLAATQSGDRGVTDDHYILPGEPRIRVPAHTFTPTGIAEFARAVTDTHYQPVTDLRHAARSANWTSLAFALAPPATTRCGRPMACGPL